MLIALFSGLLLVNLLATRISPRQAGIKPQPQSRIAAAPDQPLHSDTAALKPASAPATPTQQITANLRRIDSLDRHALLLPPAPPPAPARIDGDGPYMPGTLVAQTERLDLIVGGSTFTPEQIAAIAPLIEQALREDEIHFGTTLEHRVTIAFYRPKIAPIRGVRGLAYTDTGQTEIYYQPYEDVERAVTVVAHELGHHLESQRYGEAVQRRADTILHEGMATWISAGRWLKMCGGESWREHARELSDAGIPLRLLTAESSGADNAYELWASFVDFLAQNYGWGKLDALYRSSSGRAPGSADYQGITGKSLDELADEWRAWVRADS